MSLIYTDKNRTISNQKDLEQFLEDCRKQQLIENVTFAGVNIWQNLQNYILRNVTFSQCRLTNIELGEAKLEGVRLEDSKLLSVYLGRSSLFNVVFFRCELAIVTLNSSQLSEINIISSRVVNSDWAQIEIRRGNLRGINFDSVNLCGSLFIDTEFENVSFHSTDLSGVGGLLDPIDYLKNHFAFTKEGMIVYKVFNLYRETPSYWEIAPGRELRETVNPDPTVTCGSGINVSTLGWIMKNSDIPDRSIVWKGLIRYEWLPGVVVPYNTDGKIRTSRLLLLEEIGPKKFL